MRILSPSAQTLLASLPRGQQRLGCLLYWVREGARRDVSRTRSFIDSLPEEDQNVLRLKLARELADDEAASHSPHEALDVFAQLPPSIERSQGAARLAGRLAREDPAALMRWLANHPDALDPESMIRAAAEPWVANDLESAQTSLLELPDSPAARQLAAEVAKKLLATSAHAKAVLEFAAEIPEDGIADALQRVYDTHRAEREPEAFLRDAAQSESPLSAEAIKTALSQWAVSDVNAALRWAREQAAADRLDPHTMEALARDLARTDLMSARAVVDAVMEDASLTSTPRSALVSLTNAWTPKAPEEAGAWALFLTNPKFRDEAVSAVISEWSRFDWPSARQWLETLPPGEPRDKALKEARWPLVSRNPRLLLEALPLVSSQETRQDLRQKLFTQWKTQDAIEARAAAESLDLPSEEMDALFPEKP